MSNEYPILHRCFIDLRIFENVERLLVKYRDKNFMCPPFFFFFFATNSTLWSFMVATSIFRGYYEWNRSFQSKDSNVHVFRGHRKSSDDRSRKDMKQRPKGEGNKPGRQRISATRRLDGIVNFVEELLNFSKSRSFSIFVSPSTHNWLILAL